MLYDPTKNCDFVCVITKEVTNLQVGDLVYITDLEYQFMHGLNGKSKTNSIWAVVQDFRPEESFGVAKWIPTNAIEVLGEL